MSELDPAARAAATRSDEQDGEAESAAAPPPPLFSEVTVLLGDPELPDPVKRTGLFEAEDFESFARMKRALAELAETRGYRFSCREDHRTLLSDFAESPPAFVLNFCDTGYRNDAARELHLPAFLELLGVPYSGAGPTCLGLCYDKALVRAIAAGAGVPVPEERMVHPEETPAEAIAAWRGEYPVLLKPSRGDGSVGITQNAVAEGPERAVAYLEGLRVTLPGQPLLIQEFLAGREVGVGLIGNPGNPDGLRDLPVMEVDFSRLPEDLPPILSYESKAEPASPYYTDIVYRQAQLDEDTRSRLVARSALLFERLGCRDYARFDFRADAAGTIKLLEVNPNPAWCWDGKMCFMAGFAGHTYPELLGMILDAAQRRAARAG